MKLLRVKSKGVNQLAGITPVIKALNVAKEVDRHCGASLREPPRG